MEETLIDNPHVTVATLLDDIGQPYSCTQWGNSPDSGASQLVHDTNTESSMWSLFETGGAVPSTVWIDHNMRVLIL